MISKRATSFMLGVLMLLSMMSFVAITAQDSTSTETQTTKKEEIEQRVEARKLAIQSVLDEKKSELIAKKCEKAQIKIGDLATKLGATKQRRLNQYNAFGEKLRGFEIRLNEAGVDTAGLTTVLDEYDTMLENMTTVFDEYNLAVNDMADMECSEDADGFQATLMEARALVGTIKNNIQEIHDFLRQDVRQAFTNAMRLFNNADDSTDSISDEEESSEQENESTQGQ